LNTELVIYVTPHVLNPEKQGVQLQDEFKAMEKRGGTVEPEEFLFNGSRRIQVDTFSVEEKSPKADSTAVPDSSGVSKP
jgi:hypothetical protein